MRQTRSVKHVKYLKKIPPKPVVKLPITCEFNKVSTLDLKENKIGLSLRGMGG